MTTGIETRGNKFERQTLNQHNHRVVQPQILRDTNFKIPQSGKPS